LKFNDREAILFLLFAQDHFSAPGRASSRHLTARSIEASILRIHEPLQQAAPPVIHAWQEFDDILDGETTIETGNSTMKLKGLPQQNTTSSTA
jgi:hypothetical protein